MTQTAYKPKLLHKSEHHQTITFVILEPWVEDRNGDIISSNEIIKTAHEFMANLSSKYVNINHQDNTQQAWVQFVESFVLPVDLPMEQEIITAWSWLVAFKFEEQELYDKVIAWDIVWVSMEWYWIQ